MAENKQEISMAFSGGIYIAPTTAIAPTGVGLSQIPAGAVLVGFTDDGGVTITPTSDSAEISAWPRGEVVATSNTNGKVEIGFNAYQDNDDNMEVYTGKAKSGNGFVLDAAYFGGSHMLIVRAVDLNKGTERLWVAPEAELSARSEITLNHTTISGLGMTFTARYNEALGGQIVRYDGPYVAPVQGS